MIEAFIKDELLEMMAEEKREIELVEKLEVRIKIVAETLDHLWETDLTDDPVAEKQEAEWTGEWNDLEEEMGLTTPSPDRLCQIETELIKRAPTGMDDEAELIAIDDLVDKLYRDEIATAWFREAVPSDWDGYYQAVKNSDIPYSRKAVVDAIAEDEGWYIFDSEIIYNL